MPQLDPRDIRARSSQFRLGYLLGTYGTVGIFRLGRDWIWTRLIFPGARLVRWPFYVRGKRFIQIGSGFTTGPGLRLDAFASDACTIPQIRIGDDVQLNDYVHIAAMQSVQIGNRVLIASKVFISDHNHGTYAGAEEHSSPAVPPLHRIESCAPVVIADDVWLGESVAVLPGVTIGRGSIVGALALVNRDIPPYCIAVGNPARVIKRYDFEKKQWIRV